MHNLIEFFAGSRSVGTVADDMCYRVFSTDIHNFKDIDYVVDVLEFDTSKVPFIPDVGWFSPPCQGFSVAAIGRNWEIKDGVYIPKTESARLSLRLVAKTLELIEHYTRINPDFIYFIENPRGMLRKMPVMQNYTRYTVTYCQYGDFRMKPTDIWSNCKHWHPKAPCKNGDSCHQAAPRGSRTGTQGLKNDYERSKLPEALCEEILTACNRQINQLSTI